MNSDLILLDSVKMAIDNNLYLDGQKVIDASANDGCLFLKPANSNTFQAVPIYQFLFSHNFCKAFFGTLVVCPLCGSDHVEIRDNDSTELDWECNDCKYDNSRAGSNLKLAYQWLYRMREMAASGDPISYLKGFI